MDFERLKQKVGFGLAVVISKEAKALSEEFFNSLTFDQWLSVYQRASSGSELEKTALTKMSEFVI